MIKLLRSGIVYITDKDNTKKLKAIIKQYNIKTPALCYNDVGELLFWKYEIEDIEKQYKLARKQERQK